MHHGMFHGTVACVLLLHLAADVTAQGFGKHRQAQPVSVQRFCLGLIDRDIHFAKLLI